MAWTPEVIPFIPCPEEAEAACTFGGRVQHDILRLIRSGDFAEGANALISADIVKKWTKGTRETKERAVTLFLAYLRTVGAVSKFFPDGRQAPEDSCFHRREQERALCCFSLLRVMCGQTTKGALGYVSHIRTWFRTLYLQPFGDVGVQGRPSLTSQYMTALQEFFPTKSTDEIHRLPATWKIVQTVMIAARAEGRLDLGTCAVVCFAGLYRLGELCSTTAAPFNHEVDMAESDLLFLPTFWDATRVEIHMGPTKADRSGAKARFNGRMLPVDGTDSWSPGNVLRNLIIVRHRLRKGQDPPYSAVPLFQNERRGQLASRTVVDFMRKVLLHQRMAPAQVARYSGHSFRIGGATRLFQLQASPEVLKLLGGWSSDAYKVYVRIRQQDLMEYSSRICKG